MALLLCDKLQLHSFEKKSVHYIQWTTAQQNKYLYYIHYHDPTPKTCSYSSTCPLNCVNLPYQNEVHILNLMPPIGLIKILLYLEWTGYLHNLLVQSKATDLTSCICQWETHTKADKRLVRTIPDTGLSVVVVWLVIQNASPYLDENFTFSELVLFLYSWKHCKVSTFITQCIQKLQSAWDNHVLRNKTQCIHHVLTASISSLQHCCSESVMPSTAVQQQSVTHICGSVPLSHSTISSGILNRHWPWWMAPGQLSSFLAYQKQSAPRKLCLTKCSFLMDSLGTLFLSKS